MYTLYGLIKTIVHWNYNIIFIMAFSSSIRKAQIVNLCELCETETHQRVHYMVYFLFSNKYYMYYSNIKIYI